MPKYHMIIESNQYQIPFWISTIIQPNIRFKNKNWASMMSSDQKEHEWKHWKERDAESSRQKKRLSWLMVAMWSQYAISSTQKSYLNIGNKQFFLQKKKKKGNKQFTTRNLKFQGVFTTSLKQLQLQLEGNQIF